jgi:hypothetical protein
LRFFFASFAIFAVKVLSPQNRKGRRVAQAFDFAGITNKMGAPSFAFFAKGGPRKWLRMWLNSVAA